MLTTGDSSVMPNPYRRHGTHQQATDSDPIVEIAIAESVHAQSATRPVALLCAWLSQRQFSVEIPYSEENGQGLKYKSLISLSLLVRPAGIEPATPAFGGQYSIH